MYLMIDSVQRYGCDVQALGFGTAGFLHNEDCHRKCLPQDFLDVGLWN